MRVSGLPYVQARNSYGTTTKYGIAIHCTANTASAEAEAAYAQRRIDGVSAHLFVDHDSIVQTLDTTLRAGHAGSSIGNANAIAVEITGLISWSRSKWLSSVAWDKLGAALAAIIRAHWPDGSFQVRRASAAEMKANPRVKALYAHDDMRQAWGGTTHTDPGPNFPWDRLLDAINAHLGDDMPSVRDIWLSRESDVVPRFAPPDDPNPNMTPAYALGWTAMKVNQTYQRLGELEATQRAILEKVAGADTAAIVAAIEAQGEQTRARLEQLVSELGPAIAAAVVERVDRELDEAAVGAAVAEVLAARLAS